MSDQPDLASFIQRYFDAYNHNDVEAILSMVGVEQVLPDGKRLDGVRIYRRDDSGRLTTRTVARRAEYRDRSWTLVDAVVTDLWTPENGFVTPTFKVKRDRIDAAYGAQFEVWVQSAMPVVWVRH